MLPRFVDSLVCPVTRQPLELEVYRRASGGDVVEGLLRTADGRFQYKITNSIPRFVPDEGYATNFGFEWRVFREVLFNEEHFRTLPELFEKRYALSPENVRGKRVLDVGCGAGRFSFQTHQWGAREVVGIDLSDSVDIAQENVGGPQPGMQFVQADIFQLPFRSSLFDVAFSIGVLHHTPDPRLAFESLVPLVRPGGRITAGLYTKNWGFGDVLWRCFTPRLPKRVLYGLSHVAIPLYYIYRIPGIGRLLHQALPIYMSSSARERVLNTFDWYSPVHQHYVPTEEIVDWFVGAGLMEVEVTCAGHVTAKTLPARGSADGHSTATESELIGSGL